MKKGSVLYYDYIVVDIHSNFYEFTSNNDLNLGEIAKSIGVGSEEIAEINKYGVRRRDIVVNREVLQ